MIYLYSTSSSGANSFSSHANSSSGFALQMAAASASASGQVAGPGQAAGPPLVTLASSNFLMPPPANHSQSSHSSNEDIGCSNEVRLKLHVRIFFFVFFSIKSSL